MPVSHRNIGRGDGNIGRNSRYLVDFGTRTENPRVGGSIPPWLGTRLFSTEPMLTGSDCVIGGRSLLVTSVPALRVSGFRVMSCCAAIPAIDNWPDLSGRFRSAVLPADSLKSHVACRGSRARTLCSCADGTIRNTRSLPFHNDENSRSFKKILGASGKRDPAVNSL